MAITDKDVEKIRQALKPDFENLESKFNEKINSQTSEIKTYIHEGFDTVLEGVDNMFKEHVRLHHSSKFDKTPLN